MADKVLEVRANGCGAGFISDSGEPVAGDNLPVYLRRRCDPFKTEHSLGGVLVYMSDREYEQYQKSQSSE